MLTKLDGDLFATPGLDALAQGVNCLGVMGAGIAVGFKRRWPVMHHRYRVACAAGLQPGESVVCPETRPAWIYCLATQPRPGPWATVAAIREATQRMVAHAREAGVKRIGMPRIGCGHGGLRWEDVRPALEAAAVDVELVVVSLPRVVEMERREPRRGRSA